ncbi:MAG: heavy-metal-associated domain-containing protein [Chloroflexi bacterium]|nr:heavy-metal-associated domain-containing protein [Chloroflexota bacterium]MBV9596431.1 heavy-metal-associated domain-containing protein [Chloroflexota bacterium]
MSTVVMNVPDISCEHCERTITNALTALNGSESVRVSIPARQVYVATRCQPRQHRSDARGARRGGLSSRRMT